MARSGRGRSQTWKTFLHNHAAGIAAMDFLVVPTVGFKLLFVFGSIRRECLDRIVVFGDAHLRRILVAYTGYYNQLRTHLSLDKDSPAQRPIQRLDQLAAQPIVGGLHHRYCRI
jgi:hypothetical protein